MVNDASAPENSLMTRAGQNGLRLGVYITVLMLATGLSAYFSFASFVVWIGSIAMPFYLCHLLAASARMSPRRLGVPELWAEGIASFFLGCLPPAAVCYLLLKFVAPDFVYDVFAQSIAVFSSIGTAEGDSMAETFQRLVDEHLLPTAADVTAQFISLNIIAGTVLSLIGAVVTKVRSASFQKQSDKQ